MTCFDALVVVVVVVVAVVAVGKIAPPAILKLPRLAPAAFPCSDGRFPQTSG